MNRVTTATSVNIEFSEHASKSFYSFMSTLRNFHAGDSLSTGGGVTKASVIDTTRALISLTLTLPISNNQGSFISDKTVWFFG